MASSGEITIGIDSQSRSSSRILKPPGGGHSNIFAEPDAQAPKPRPKYNQQNSSNLNHCMNTTDPNEMIAAQAGELPPSDPAPSGVENNIESAGKPSGASSGGFLNGGDNSIQLNGNNNQSGRVRVPPGGFSSGLW